MHVLILPSWYFPADSGEITGRMFHQHAKALRKAGIDARVLFAEFNPASSLKEKINFSDEEGVPTMRISGWFFPKVNRFMIRLWVKKYIKAILSYMETHGVPDIMHAQGYLTGIVAEAVNRKTAIPFIVTERSSQFIMGSVPDQYKSFINGTFNQAYVVTCVSPGLKVFLQPYFQGHIEVVPNFFDPTVFYFDPLMQKNEIFTWVSIGEPAKVKGLYNLMHAYGRCRKKMPSVKMQLIMIDNISEKEELVQIANQYQVAGEIIWTGLISQPEIAEILKKSHALISASKVETFGKAILEAQACGLPVVATRTDGADYILTKPDQGIIVAIDDVDELSKALSDLYLNFHRYDAQKISEAIAQFSEEKVIGQWLGIYHKVAG